MSQNGESSGLSLRAFWDVGLVRSAVARLRILSTAQRIAGGRRCLLHRRGVAAFHQARALFEDHAALHSVARGHGADQRRFRDPRRLGAAGAGNAKDGGVGIGGGADRRVSGEHIYGAGRGGCGRHRTVAEMGTASFTRGADLLAAVVYAAEVRAALTPMRQPR